MSADLYLPVFLSFFLYFFRLLISELAERNSTIFSHMVRNKCNLKMRARNLGYPTPYKSGAQKPLFWANFATQRQLYNGLYLPNETRYRQSVKNVDNYEVSATSSQNDMNFGPQTASKSTCIFTHSP